MTTPASPNIYLLWDKRPDATSLSVWAHTIQNEQDPAITECFITKMEHMKSTFGKRHEFLIFTLQHGQGSRRPVAQLMTDRDVTLDGLGNNRAKRFSRVFSGNSATSLCSADSLQSVSSSSVKHIEALDRLYFGDLTTFLNDRSPFETLRTLTFKEGAFPVINFTVLLTTVHDHLPRYRVDDSQCYWFAHTVYSTSLHLFNGHHVSTGKDKAQGKYMNLVPIPQAKSTEEIIELYKAAWETHKKKGVNPNERLRMEREAREESDRIAQQERAAREESDRIAQQERKVAQQERAAREESERNAQQERAGREESERNAQQERKVAQQERAAREASERELREMTAHYEEMFARGSRVNHVSAVNMISIKPI